MVVTGAVIQGLYSTYLDFLGNEFLSAPMLFIIVGVVIFLVAFFGCCGAVRENSCMMLTVRLLFLCVGLGCGFLTNFVLLLVLRFPGSDLCL